MKYSVLFGSLIFTFLFAGLLGGVIGTALLNMYGNPVAAYCFENPQKFICKLDNSDSE